MQEENIDRDKNAEHTNLEEYNKDIDEAMAEVAKGESYTHEEVIKMSKNW